ncbi:MAG: radical SAM protein [Defluviitaleaceae bacterium]|nr:radical SAM protein [Defluviitaleaceae bacterium]
MNYLKLSPKVLYYGDKNEGCLYHIFEEKIEPLTGYKNEILHKSICDRISFDEIEKIYGTLAGNFVKEMIANGVAYLYDKDVYVEPVKLVSEWEIRGCLEKPMDLDDLYIQITDECNLKCDFCSLDAVYNKCKGCFKWKIQDKQISTEKFLSILGQFCKLKIGNVVFSGGNPLLSWERVVETVLYLKNKGMKTNYCVKTNGFGISDSIIKDCMKHEITFDFVMIENSDVTSVAIEKIRNIVEYKTSEIMYKDKNAKINYDNVNTAEVILNENRSKTIKTFLERMDTAITDISNRKKFSNCLSKTLAITMSGKLLPCPAFDDYIGDLTKESLIDIFQLQKQDRFTRLSKDNMLICKKCPYRYACVDCTYVDMLANNGDIGLLCSKPEHVPTDLS